MMGNLANAHMAQYSMPRHASSSSFFDIFEGFFPFLQELRRCSCSVTRSISMPWKFRITYQVCLFRCVVLEQVLTASPTRLKIFSKSSSHERISFLERGPFHLWCFCRRRPKEVLKCFKDITKIKKRKPPSIHATLWPRYLTQMM